jgi:hypothetical protein
MWTRHRHHRKARAAFVWAVLAFVGLQLALNVVLEKWRPQLSDPEFDARLAALRKQQSATPRRPMLLVVGSSRMVMNFRPEILPPLATPKGEAPLVFNFSHFGAGPKLNLVEMHRLFRKKVRPDWIVLEVMPPFLSAEGTSMLTTVTESRDLPILRRYLDPTKLYGRFLRARLVPCYQRRLYLCRDFLPALLPSDLDALVGDFRFDALGGYRPPRRDEDFTPRDIARQREVARSAYFAELQNFQIKPDADQALRETIALGQRRGARVVLLLAPEATTFRDWYAPAAKEELAAYCRDLGATYKVPVIDARDWLPDDDFFDGHHVFRRGADRFTHRLAAEVLQPLVAGNLGK